MKEMHAASVTSRCTCGITEH